MRWLWMGMWLCDGCSVDNDERLRFESEERVEREGIRVSHNLRFEKVSDKVRVAESEDETHDL